MVLLTRATPRPGARRAVGAAIWRGDFLVHGGFGLGGEVAAHAVAGDTWCWRDGWLALDDGGPPPARYPSLCSAGDVLWRFGGCGFDGGRATFLDGLWVWDGTWRAVESRGPRPAGRYTSALASHRGDIYAFGGVSQDSARVMTFYDDLWRFSDGTWHCIQPGGGDATPGPRYGFGWAQDGARVYVFGGFDGRSDRSDFWVLDLDLLTWSRLADGPPARYCPALGIAGGRVVLFGGRSKIDSRRNHADTWLYDGAWQQLDTPSPGYHAKPAYASDGQALWIYAGEGPNGHLSDVWRFSDGRWSCLDEGGDDDPILW